MESTSNTAAAGSASRSPDAVPPSDSIMMWGAKGSGKSIYIASLVYWSPPADAARRVCVLPANSTAAEWVADRVRGLAGESGHGSRDSGFTERSLFGAPTPAFGTPVPGLQSRVPSPQYKTLTERRLDFRLYTLPTTVGPI